MPLGGGVTGAQMSFALVGVTVIVVSSGGAGGTTGSNLISADCSISSVRCPLMSWE